ncbi:hypothetical protein PGTUg99_014712 [Puccinia graminis f. sp. tritici]|uniref:Uncharacterized protein n=1 Tax=Puccinia graminis f. sp. tritici TaxID=56615 RepID=A0A5B0S4I7_PUCGR|nr:hypothetical protein PGTUg99_014712 [Puccinia graminis f. sp. tritici]
MILGASVIYSDIGVFHPYRYNRAKVVQNSRPGETQVDPVEREFNLAGTQRDGSKKSRPPCRRPGRKGDHMTHQGASGTQGCTGAPRHVRAALWVSMVSLRRDRVDPQEARPGGDWGGRLGVDMAVGSSSLCHGDDTDRGAMRPGSSGTVYGWGGVILATRVKVLHNQSVGQNRRPHSRVGYIPPSTLGRIPWAPSRACSNTCPHGDPGLVGCRGAMGGARLATN